MKFEKRIVNFFTPRIPGPVFIDMDWQLNKYYKGLVFYDLMKLLGDYAAASMREAASVIRIELAPFKYPSHKEEDQLRKSGRVLWLRKDIIIKILGNEKPRRVYRKRILLGEFMPSEFRSYFTQTEINRGEHVRWRSERGGVYSGNPPDIKVISGYISRLKSKIRMPAS